MFAVHSPAVVLTVVIPAFNEEAAIGRVIESWTAEISKLGVPYEIRAYDDGSTDGTRAEIDAIAARIPNVVACHHANRGHGPTILRGYAEATGTWVFQVDGDDEMPADSFPEVWSAREHADVVLGIRTARVQPLGRKIISAVSRAAVSLLFGRGVDDVNTPYRLFRKETLARLLPAVPPDTFAPNVALAGLAVRRGFRIAQVPVPHHGRKTGTSSFGKLSMWKSALRSLRETIAIAWSERS